jgi:hypothetical protein
MPRERDEVRAELEKSIRLTNPIWSPASDFAQPGRMSEGAGFARSVVSTRLTKFRREMVGAVAKTLTIEQQPDAFFKLPHAKIDDPLIQGERSKISAEDAAGDLAIAAGG